MRTFFLIFMVLVSMVFSHTLKAEVSQEIALTVSSDGPTKEEATKNALRSAIEQAYGAFVSANTTILNDELVKDEIITVSNGSIKEYKEISAIETAKGGYMVTLSTVVSLPHLITYAQNHGSECEFAGSTFAMNERIKEAQINNAKQVIENLKSTIMNFDNLFDYEVVLDNPEKKGDYYKISFSVNVIGNTNTLNVLRLVNRTFSDLSKNLYSDYGYDKNKYSRPDQLDYYERHPFNLSFGGGEVESAFLSKINKFKFNDNLSSPSNVIVAPEELRIKRLSDCRGLDVNYCIYLVYGYGSLKKPYDYDKFEKDCNRFDKHLLKHINEQRKSFRDWGGIYSKAKIANNLDDVVVFHRIVPYRKQYNREYMDHSWAIEGLYFDRYFPIAVIKGTMMIPKDDISKYSKFWVEAE